MTDVTETKFEYDDIVMLLAAVLEKVGGEVVLEEGDFVFKGDTAGISAEITEDGALKLAVE